MDRVFEISMLLDFYGELLTARQREALEQYYNMDLSFSEIADNTGITRQAVYDNIKRGKESLVKLEGKLGLAKRFMEIKEHIKKISDVLENTANNDMNSINISIEQAKTLVQQIITKY